MPINPDDLVDEISEAAFICDKAGRIIAWNKHAESLLGYSAETVIGRPCHEVICGKDLFGNLYCRKDCNLRQMVRGKEAIHSFEFLAYKDSHQAIMVNCLVLPLSETPQSQNFEMLHVLQPVPVKQYKVSNSDTYPIPSSSSVPFFEARSKQKIHVDPALTRRELEVLKLLAEGLSPNEVAGLLNICLTTVRTHIENILRKLNAHNKLQAVLHAQRLQLI